RAMPAPQNFWEGLFATDAARERGVRVQLRVLRKRGTPFLLLPRQPQAADAALSLYPAQTGRARAARGLLRCLLRGSLPFGGKNLALAIPPNDEFVRFLGGQAGTPADGVPAFGVLAGNPASEGQRFLVLVFDTKQRPVAVVKAGLSPQAKELIEKERRFLEQAPAHTAGLPKLRGQLDCARLRAFALGFFDGDSPRPAQGSGFEALLSSWVDTKFKMPLSDAPTWRMLERNSPAHELFGFLARR
ncbi:MAG: hypothetical protein DME25_20545, partial [Verrucomicrobia bacterium]